MKSLLLISSVFLFLQSNFILQDSTSVADSTSKSVLATYYHRKFEGHRTTSGARYRAKKLTAAHRTLPMGTMVTVTNPVNGKSVVVKVNDRGPYSKKLAIDLSESAAKKIGIYRLGIAKVKLSYTVE
ncbi:septal ring lytic transglycosylase RlpA family protein [Pedobacter sp. AW1-32]|uniref:septal ring lytic transglycosylase RlpA family protein n=1 Tax=Pedobacter sp. AW1-32 TaxID=3383026 RepID=UPI003FEFAF72